MPFALSVGSAGWVPVQCQTLCSPSASRPQQAPTTRHSTGQQHLPEPSAWRDWMPASPRLCQICGWLGELSQGTGQGAGPTVPFLGQPLHEPPSALLQDAVCFPAPLQRAGALGSNRFGLLQRIFPPQGRRRLLGSCACRGKWHLAVVPGVQLPPRLLRPLQAGTYCPGSRLRSPAWLAPAFHCGTAPRTN